MGVSANRINLVLVVDRSGSMGGQRWNGVCRGVIDAISNLTSSDIVTVVTFNNTVDVIGPAPQASFPLREFAAKSPSGGTALYDAIIAGLLGAVRLHVAVDMAQSLQTLTYVVVMTDGEDTESKASLAMACAAVEQINHLRNFKVGRGRVRRVCGRGAHCTEGRHYVWCATVGG